MNFDAIDKGYDIRAAIPGDISEHMPKLRENALLSDRIVEFGVGWGCSTWSLLAGHPKWMRSYDIRRYEPHFSDVERAAAAAGMDYKIMIQSSTAEVIETCDFLFIDSSHYYEHCLKELQMHGGQVKRFIGFHDTTEFEFTDENRQGRGLWPAIEEFMTANPEWRLAERFTNCNGLTILQRIHK